MKLFVPFVILILFSNSFFPQCKSGLPADGEKPFYTFTFPATGHKLILCGYMEKMTKESIYASEFYVINSYRKDTVVFFGALQDCRIDKKNDQVLNIIETKKLPFGKNNNWIDCDYIKYSFTEDRNSKITVNKTIILKVPAVDDDFKRSVYNKYETVIKKKIRQDEELNYQILLLALNGDAKAKDILLNMKRKIKLDGALAEFNSEAIEIYNSYTQKQ